MEITEKKILVIDDDARNVFALSAVLRSRGYACISAYSAEQGLDLLVADAGVGLVLMDMMMPDMDGYTAIPEIRKNKKISSVPVIAVTAQAMVGDMEKCLTAGADAYLSKPVDVDKLMGLLNELLK